MSSPCIGQQGVSNLHFCSMHMCFGNYRACWAGPPVVSATLFLIWAACSRQSTGTRVSPAASWPRIGAPRRIARRRWMSPSD